MQAAIPRYFQKFVSAIERKSGVRVVSIDRLTRKNVCIRLESGHRVFTHAIPAKPGHLPAAVDVAAFVRNLVSSEVCA